VSRRNFPPALAAFCVAIFLSPILSILFAGGPSIDYAPAWLTGLAAGVPVPLGVDRSTWTLQTIDYEHHEIHAGSHFFLASYTTLASGASATFVVTTPNTTKWAHMVFVVEGTLATSFAVHEGSSGVTGGTAETPINSNRNSATTSTLAILCDPDVASLGTQLMGFSAGTGTVPSQAAPGSADRSHEIVLKQNATYTFRITSGANGNVVSWQANWYEHTDKTAL
jgi:hypothetical protein